MTPERWLQVERIYHEADARLPGERASFLDQVCAGDTDLRGEVERMLAGDSETAGFLEAPAMEVAARALAHDQARSEEPLTGKMISHYRILEKLGEGGMGVVYKAKDTRLGRSVALKFIKAQFSRHWEREARAVAALNHPHIATLHEVGEHEGSPYLVMELVDGRPVKGPLPVKQAIEYGIQMADALAAAHAAGIVHRDLKPGNILVTEKGSVKVLDFGLAKLAEPEGAPVSTQTAGLAGTPGYLAPEQIEGQPADTRSDIFAFGCILYELVSGHRAFPGETITAALTATATTEPKPLEGVPERLDELVRRCLRKDPARRFQHMDDVKVELEELKQAGGGAATFVSHLSRKLRRIAIPVLLAAVLVAGGLYYRSRQTKPLTDKDSIVLADFTNTTGDSVFDDTLKQGLSVQLEQSPFLNLVSERRVNDTLKLMGRAAGDRLTPEVAREVCQRTSSKAMLAGSIAGLGSQYVIGLKAVDCDTGDVLAEAQEQAAAKEAVLKALDAAAVSLRKKLGESLSSVEKYATPLAEATTPSLEALKVYSLGLKTWNAKGDTAALPFFQRAVDLDPNFAMAYGWMSVLYHDLNQIVGAVENGRKAYDLREKVSERERFWIEGSYYDFATEDLEKGAEIDELWQQTYPRDAMPYIRLGFVSATLGNWEKALEEWRVAMRLDPNNGLLYYLLSVAYMSGSRLDEAEAVFKQAEERNLENEQLLQSRYWLAFLKGDTAKMAQLVSAAVGKSGAENLLLAAQADTEGWYGKLKNAHELTGRAMDSATHNNAKETAAGYQAEAALREVESGNREQARAEANAALKLAPNRDVRAMVALALARAGDTAGAENLAAELDKTFPLDTLVQRYWLPTIRAGGALEGKDPNRAIDLLKVASMIELSSATGDLTIFLCPVYVRGEAYLMAHDGNRAAAEFQKFIDHRGVVVNFPWGALARLGLARAYALQGDTAKARAVYQDFLTLWKDADPDIPVLKEAQAEYAKLP
ncbi:MAG: protein kinase [Candidatus Solibacter sp.]|jgi:serine/threonine protein kinase/Tfp pilus assembly protein PilF